MESRRIRWKGYVACKQGMRATYQVLVGKDLPAYVGGSYENMRITSEWTIHKWGVKEWIGSE
jgi:hypothetical protein